MTQKNQSKITSIPIATIMINPKISTANSRARAKQANNARPNGMTLDALEVDAIDEAEAEEENADEREDDEEDADGGGGGESSDTALTVNGNGDQPTCATRSQAANVAAAES